MTYIENPKTKGSGIIAAIPQRGMCPIGCADCFFQSGRSYLEPLEKNLPNMPSEEHARFNVVRVNDGNDSNNQRELVIESTKQYPMKFFNTSIPKNLKEFVDPVVLTVNPHQLTDTKYHKLRFIPINLMFIRIRVNTWNLALVDEVIDYYTHLERPVPVVLTFMAYYGESHRIPERHRENYVYRKRTLNSYNAITTRAWRDIMEGYKDNKFVHSCGKIEGELGDTKCKFCGNCLREYFATMERLR